MSDASDRIRKVLEEVMERRNLALQEYIIGYLNRTGAKIEELTLVEQVITDGLYPKYVWYLAKKLDLGI